MFHWKLGPTLPSSRGVGERACGAFWAEPPIVPVIEMCGYQSVMAMPICSRLRGGVASARRTSGRRSSNSAGMPTTTSGGAAGIGLLPSRACRSMGGMPSKVQIAFWLCRKVISKAGIGGLGLGKVAFGLVHVQLACRPLS